MGKNILSGVRPTRMELLKLKKRKILAQKGHDLLEEKRDALIMEFFKRIKNYRKDKAELEIEIKKAFETLIEAQMVIGYTGLEESSYSVNEMKDIEMKVRNITGVKVPLIEKMEFLRESKERGYSFVSTSAKLDEAANSFENVVKNILRLAESEGSIRKLAQEIEKTKRRVNALENILIPKLGNTQNYIKMHLAELEREDFFRRKKIKSALKDSTD
ncbi:MAG: V-type ATP synthase subunit D [Methanosarcinaceae archaeon]|nr:V-type ATP synthase subunit D [Methanosarcinaceae archaeon]